MSDVSRRFVASIIQRRETVSFMDFAGADALFEFDEAGLKLYRALADHVDKFGEVPSAAVMLKTAQVDLSEVEAPDSPKYYLAEVRKRHVHRALATTAEHVSEQLKLKDPMAALEILAEVTTRLRQHEAMQRVYDFRDAAKVLWPHLVDKWSGKSQFATFGWPTLDAMAGGVGGGDFVSFTGRPARGKTWFLLFIALHIWRDLGLPVLFVSMEMMAPLIFERLAAMHTSTKMDWIKTGGFPTLVKNTKAEFRGKLAKLESAEAPFYIVDGNLTSTGADIINLTKHLGVKAVLIDGAYLVSHPKAKNRFEAAAENCRIFKNGLATECGVPTFSSWQFNRESTKLSKNKTAGLEHIGFTDEVGQLSTVALGLLEDDSPETIFRRRVDVMKGRNGEVGQFAVNWDFNSMDFSEFKEQAGELAFL